jgi:hypothetical protein
VAYVREKTVTVGGKVYGPYFQLVEAYREGDKVRQRVIAHLGKFPTIDDARQYADEHYSATPIEDLREICREVDELRDASHYLGQPEDERRKVQQRVEELQERILPLFDSLCEEDQETVRSEYRSVISGLLNRRWNHHMSSTIKDAFAGVVAKYQKLGRTDEVDAEAVRVWESLDRERQVYTLNNFISRELEDSAVRAIREHQRG